jgi:hypothetical protein
MGNAGIFQFNALDALAKQLVFDGAIIGVYDEDVHRMK